MVIPFRRQEPGDSTSKVRLSEIISALSFALDLTEDAVPGHALRCCVLGMRMGERLGLDAEMTRALYYALLLKDIGCSSNAARMCEIFRSDDRAMKSAVKLIDWTGSSGAMLAMLWKQVLPAAGPIARMAQIVRIATAKADHNQEMIQMRCDRGASIVRKIGMGEKTAEGVRCLDEHWDGGGYPEHRQGRAIPVLSRILLVAQHLDVFASERGVEAALAVLEERSGRWFDPELVKIVLALNAEGTLWKDCLRGDVDVRHAVIDLEPGEVHSLDEGHIDQVCEAFADVVDAKSPFTFKHSLGVARVTVGIARTMNLSSASIKRLQRAALLHDIGKLRVPNSILDKPGRLTADEFRLVQEHPGLSREILGRVGPFAGMAEVAGDHHERLDGSGYPNRMVAAELSMEARIVQVADVYGALSEDRPYRAGLGVEEIKAIMGKEVPMKLDGGCYEALLQTLGTEPELADTAAARGEGVPEWELRMSI